MTDDDRTRNRIRSTSGARLAREGAAVADRRADERVVVTWPPDLAVEVLSPSNAKYDRSLKLRAYLKHRIPHYWVVDPKRHKLEERVLGKKTYRLVATLSGPVMFRSQLFPELAIDLGRVWCDLD
jgi:Uma2 family endonuclease